MLDNKVKKSRFISFKRMHLSSSFLSGFQKISIFRTTIKLLKIVFQKGNVITFTFFTSGRGSASLSENNG